MIAHYTKEIAKIGIAIPITYYFNDLMLYRQLRLFKNKHDKRHTPEHMRIRTQMCVRSSNQKWYNNNRTRF